MPPFCMKAYIVGHVPPGVSPDLWKWMYPDMNAKLTDIIRKYHDIVIAGIFGHEHTDNFRIIYDENGNVLYILTNYIWTLNTTINKKIRYCRIFKCSIVNGR